MWKVCISEEERYQNVEKIFPLQQRDVGKIIDALRKCETVEKVIIFGSSVTSACNPWSDIDIYLKLKEEVNIRYAKTHVIEDLLDECELQNVPITFSQEFYCFSPAITKWESKTRYIKNYVLTKRQIENGFRLIKEFLLSNGVNSGALELSKALTDKMNCF